MRFGMTTRAFDLLNRSDAGNWETRDEVGFLHGLGTHRPLDYRRELLTRPQLLVRYIEAAQERAVWGEVDRDTVIQVARNLLNKETCHA